MFKRHEVNITVNAAGAATVYSPVLNGRIFSIQYVKVDYANGVDFTMTLVNQDKSAGTGEGVWTESNVDASKTVCPRQPTHDNVGAASLFAAAGEPVEDYIVAAHEKLKIVVAAGGVSKSGKFFIKVG